MNYQKCSKCENEFPATYEYFNKGNDTKYNLKSRCKTCRSKDSKLYRDNNKESIAIKNRIYCANNKEMISTKQVKWNKDYYNKNREIQIQRSNDYYNSNIDKCREESRLSYINNIDKNKIYKKQYSINNKKLISDRFKIYRLKNLDRLNKRYKQWIQSDFGKKKSKIYSKSRQAMKLNLVHDYTVEQWEYCKKYFDFKCAYCGKSSNLTQDHFIPISKDGGYTRNNILPACKNCNSSKNNTHFYEWYKSYKFYSKERLDFLQCFIQSVGGGDY